MAIFGSKRRRPPNPPLTSNSAHSDAATAALSAFSSIHGRRPSPSLSEAAAAAALRARPHPPTDVSAVVPSRATSRRSGSAQSSHGTASPHPPLRRPGSSGSMRDRTFRSPSPHARRSLDSAAHPGQNETLPPVPSIPEEVQQPQRSGSLRIKTAPVRVASQKLKDTSRGTWFGAPAVGDISNIRTSDAVMAQTVPDPPARPDSRSSVNFSYPARQRFGSPPASPVAEDSEFALQQSQTVTSQVEYPEHRTRSKRASTTNSSKAPKTVLRQRPTSMSTAQELVYDPNSRRMVPKAELLALERILDQVDTKPPPKQKKTARSESHLAKGTIPRPQGTAVAEFPLEPIPPSPRSSSPRMAIPPVTPGGIEVISPSTSRSDMEKDGPGDEICQPHAYSQSSQGSLLSPSHYLPEVVSKEPTSPSVESYEPRPTSEAQPALAQIQEVHGDHRKPNASRVSDALDSVMTRQRVYEQPGRGSAVAAQQGRSCRPPYIALSPQELSAETPDLGYGSDPERTSVASAESKATKAVRVDRAHSNSPARVAHFGPVQRNLSVRHSPPPRSVSPRKSALKQNSPPRSGSSADDASEAGPSRVITPLPRKKLVRVSFDDRDTVLDDDEPPEPCHDRAESPVLSSTHATNGRRTWFSNIGRSKKKETASYEEDEVMMPRPALPSFGSIRGEKKKHSEEAERPLVRPSEMLHAHSVPDSPTQALTAAEYQSKNNAAIGQSSDHALATVLAQDYASRFPANTSRFREPLPPVVTSRENGDLSSDSSSKSDEELLRDTPVLSSQPSAATTVPDNELEQPVKHKRSTTVALPRGPAPVQEDTWQPVTSHATGPPAEAVPTIAITEPSPVVTEEPPAEAKKLMVPGGFPVDDSDDTIRVKAASALGSGSPASGADSAAHRQLEAAFEPVSQALNATKGVHTPSTVVATQAPAADDSDSEGSSIYSDAYEDLSDMEEHAFQSIDAVVESPISPTKTRQSLPSTPTGTPSKAQQEADESQRHVESPAYVFIPLAPQSDWEAAKAFWRSLTADKRAQLEREASEEAGADADVEREATDKTKKPRRKKSVEKRQAERQAMMEAQTESDRVYMIQPGTKIPDEPSPSKSFMRRSMRQTPPEDVASGAAGGSSRLRKSMRGSTASPTQLEPAATIKAPSVQRPQTARVAPQATTQAAGAAHRVHNAAKTSQEATSPPARSGTMNSFFPPVLKRRGSTSSESSFRRTTARRAATASPAQGGGFTLRKTMRGPAAVEGDSPNSAKRFSLRSFSPSDSGRAGSAPAPPISLQSQRFRTSLRDGGATKAQAAKNSGGIHIPSFGFKGKVKKGSRFDDSSDDEDGGRGFQSRFEDSSDDDAPVVTKKEAEVTKTSRAAVTSQPAREEPSPELPDSSDEETALATSRPVAANTRPARQLSKAASTSPQRSRSGRGSMGATPSLGTSAMKGSVPAVDEFGSSTAAHRHGSFMSTVLGRGSRRTIQRGELMDSAARRDTALERNKAELAAVRGSSRPVSPRLQKRTASMPLVPTVMSGQEDWPLSGNGSARPTSLQHRRSLSHGDVGDGVADSAGVRASNDKNGSVQTEGKKKKKFATLRRMFRLHD